MQLSVSFPETDFQPVIFHAETESLVSDAAAVAGSEWGVDVDFLVIYFEGKPISKTSQLMSHGVTSDSELEATWRDIFSKEWFVDPSLRCKLFTYFETCTSNTLRLDTPSFVNEGCFEFNDQSWIPPSVSILDFRNPDPATTSISKMLISSASVKEIGLHGLKNVTSVGDMFVRERKRLVVRGLKNVYFGGFLPSCHRPVVNLSHFNNVTSIGKYFFSECGLPSIDISELGSVVSIGDSFLEGNNLCNLDLSGLQNVTYVGHCFLRDCSFVTLDLSPLSQLSAILNSFLGECAAISFLDLSALSNVTSIGSGFLINCVSLTEIEMTGLRNVVSCGDHFLRNCRSLQSIDLASFKSLTTVGENFVSGCTGLTTLDLSGLENLTSVGPFFLSCTRTELNSTVDEFLNQYNLRMGLTESPDHADKKQKKKEHCAIL
eukprot:TRINITY_DN5409_c0_g2_i1.p1 TRINITY_DN5409_c0_g2~~TRINITY_DN5409_c0_g2_i1.p1  ORF type:complete len:462 (+),score=54.08 TRINITY_DN5409_c0_g2_i1:90-1388(+)